MRSFYEPTPEQLSRLDVPWICSYSGGKDSTSLVTWMEYLRRAGWISCDTPRLVMSDTTVEYPFLRDTARDLMNLLTASGWHCKVVTPRVDEKLYCRIFGKGLSPTHPGANRRMRWCTNSTKVRPMERYRKTIGNLLILTGLRWGESKSRDEKLQRGGCQAGGECGVPGTGEDRFAPIMTWTTCQVMDWLGGMVGKKVIGIMEDVFEITKRLLRVYHAKQSVGLGLISPKVKMLRFGCIGCPAIQTDKVLKSYGDDPLLRHLKRLYGIWDEARKGCNRLRKMRKGKMVLGPIRMEMRKRLFQVLLNIQERSGVQIVTEEDERYIRRCWEDLIYPRGWSATDEIVGGK